MYFTSLIAMIRAAFIQDLILALALASPVLVQGLVLWLCSLGVVVVCEPIEQHTASVIAHGHIAPSGTKRQRSHLAQGSFF